MEKVSINFYLPDLNASKIMTWTFHMGDSTESRFNMFPGIYLLNIFGLNIKLFKKIIEGSMGPYEVFVALKLHPNNILWVLM